MKEQKLTYYQICDLVAQKLPVPGYNIKYDFTPREIINEIVNSDDIIFHRNFFPKPDNVNVNGSQIVIVPQPKFDDEIENFEEELVDFGDVFIRTEFYLTALSFQYNVNREKEITNEINKFYELSIGRYGYISKKDYTFDISIKLKNETLFINNVMPSSSEFGENITVNLDYHYFTRSINEV